MQDFAYPFVVWTNHKNLAYLRSAKRLNSRQAQWAPFLGHLISHSPTILVPEM